MGGGPAAGKGTMVDKNPEIPKAGDGRAVVADVDAMRTQLPEYQQGIKAGLAGDYVANSVHPEASYLNKRLTSAAMERRTDLVIDGTGDSGVASVGKKIENARAAGYKVKGHYVTTDVDTAIARAKGREAKTGRGVPEQYLRDTHRNVSQIFPEIAGKFDSVSLYDTTNGAVKIATATLGGTVQVLDGALYDSFLAKGK
jgi:predicted ABC-type ATPase